METIELSNFDYPIVVNPIHFHFFFKTQGDQAYAESSKVSPLLQDLTKSLSQFEKSDQPPLLQKNLALVVRGESVLLKQFALVGSSWITRMQFINGLKKVFKEKQLKEFSGLDFVQFVSLLCNDFDRRAILDVLVCYSSKHSSVCSKSEDELLSHTYSHERLVDIFSLYFFYYDILREVKRLAEQDPANKMPTPSSPGALVPHYQQSLTIGALTEKLNESPLVKPYEKHILYKIMLILTGKGIKEVAAAGGATAASYRVFDVSLFDQFAPDREKRIDLYSFITVLCKYCIEARMQMNSIQRHHKSQHDAFTKNADYIFEMDEDEDGENV